MLDIEQKYMNFNLIAYHFRNIAPQWSHMTLKNPTFIGLARKIIFQKYQYRVVGLGAPVTESDNVKIRSARNSACS